LHFPIPTLFIEAIKKLDFFAVLDIMPSESCQMADIVLPDTYFLESSGYTSRVRNALWPMLLLREGTGALWDNKGWSAIVNGILDAMGKVGVQGRLGRIQRCLPGGCRNIHGGDEGKQWHP
jgi:anaerobic selenocysteine-containing dehydrogenase